jgi:hypothetical protein
MDTKMEMKKNEQTALETDGLNKEGLGSLFAKMVTGVLTNEANPRAKKKSRSEVYQEAYEHGWTLFCPTLRSTNHRRKAIATSQ